MTLEARCRCAGRVLVSCSGRARCRRSRLGAHAIDPAWPWTALGGLWVDSGVGVVRWRYLEYDRVGVSAARSGCRWKGTNPDQVLRALLLATPRPLLEPACSCEEPLSPADPGRPRCPRTRSREGQRTLDPLLHADPPRTRASRRGRPWVLGQLPSSSAVALRRSPRLVAVQRPPRPAIRCEGGCECIWLVRWSRG